MRYSDNKWFEKIMTRETPFLDAVWKPLQHLQWNTSLSAVGSKNGKQTGVKNKWSIIALWKTTFMCCTSWIISWNKLDKPLERRY